MIAIPSALQSFPQLQRFRGPLLHFLLIRAWANGTLQFTVSGRMACWVVADWPGCWDD